MASTKLAKTVYCLGSGGLITGCFFATKSWLIGDRTSDLLKTNNPDKQLLSKSSSVDKWKKSWFDYRVANMDRDKDFWGLSDWEKEDFINDNDSAPASFIEACEYNSNARVTSTKSVLYEEIVKWCTGSSKIKDLIRDLGKRTLSSKKFDEESWKTLLKKYSDVYKNQSKNPLNIDFIGISEQNPENNEELLSKFKGKCNELSEKEVAGTTDSFYEKVNQYCSAKIKAEDLIRDSFPSLRLVEKSKVKDLGNPVSQKLWDKYKASNKDPWAIITSTQAESRIPDNFWDKCDGLRKKEVANSEDENFKQLLNYCTVYESEHSQYAEEY